MMRRFISSETIKTVQRRVRKPKQIPETDYLSKELEQRFGPNTSEILIPTIRKFPSKIPDLVYPCNLGGQTKE